MDLSLQVEELEAERDRFEDSAIRAQYELTLVTGKYNELRAKLVALLEDT
jgi:hypothetical protein